jgi:uncharacterized protein YlxW (UPF0749 family)
MARFGGRRQRVRSGRPALAVAFFLLGLLAVIAVRSIPADPDARLPQRFRLVGLIHREQQSAAALRREADLLRAEIEAARRDAATRASRGTEDQLAGISTLAGLAPMAGTGLRVTLDDSSLRQSPTGNINDLVIHSQDVQAVVNALWRAGAEAIAVNDERVVGTSAVLCVGNTLLINGTVHSPPYRVSAIGAVSDRFEADRLVQRLHDDADSFGLRFSVSRDGDVRVPAFAGVVAPRYAEPVTP